MNNIISLKENIKKSKKKQVIQKVLVENQLKSDYLDYAMSVIISRALPDCRDGLKPVHRRILYAMYSTGNRYDKAYRKSARVVGEVMGKYHPHGDNAIYSALVRMAQDFSLRLLLIDGQGNFGSVDGDAAAQMRYTEVRLSKSSNYLLDDIDNYTVKFNENYDGSEIEPSLLPAKFPNLLINGATGIAVGMATNIPTHNVREIIDACCALIENPDITDDELMNIVPAPDFPTGGEIINAKDTKKALLVGRGTIVIRGKVIIEEKNQFIVITEIPYQTNKAEMLQSIELLIKNKIIEGVLGIYDESNKLGIRIIIEFKKSAQVGIILNQLYQNTSLQINYNINMLSLHNNCPDVMGIRKILNLFLNFRKKVITKRIVYLLKQSRIKAHILIGLNIAVININKIISIIKLSLDTIIAKNSLINIKWKANGIKNLLELVADHRNEVILSKCYITEEQAKSILEMKLQRLAVLEKNKIIEDLKILGKKIKEYLSYLLSTNKLVNLIKTELTDIKKNVGTDRKTFLSNKKIYIEDKDLIPKEKMLVTLTKSGFVKRVPLCLYKSQKRGGKGKLALTKYENDITTDILMTHTHEQLLFFSSKGKVYKLKVYQLPIENRYSKGRAIINILPIENDSVISKIMPMPKNMNQQTNFNIVFSTKLGMARRNRLSDFVNIQSTGKLAIKLEKEDSLVGVDFCYDDNHILLATQHGKAIRFPISVLRIFKSRASDGVKAVKLCTTSDKVISMSILKSKGVDIFKRDEYLKIPYSTRLKIINNQKLVLYLSDQLINIDKMIKNEQFVLTITSNGFGKRTSCYEYRITNRNSYGVLNIDTGERNGNVVSSFPVKNNDHVMLITNHGTTIRTGVNSIRVTSRNTKGVKIINLKEGEVVVSVSSIDYNDNSFT